MSTPPSTPYYVSPRSTPRNGTQGANLDVSFDLRHFNHAIVNIPRHTNFPICILQVPQITGPGLPPFLISSNGSVTLELNAIPRRFYLNTIKDVMIQALDLDLKSNKVEFIYEHTTFGSNANPRDHDAEGNSQFNLGKLFVETFLSTSVGLSGPGFTKLIYWPIPAENRRSSAVQGQTIPKMGQPVSIPVYAFGSFTVNTVKGPKLQWRLVSPLIPRIESTMPHAGNYSHCNFIIQRRRLD